jgi:hypothetical protein
VLAPLLLPLLLAAHPPADYLMSLSGVPVGHVRFSVQGAPEQHLDYRSETWARRGPVVVRSVSKVEATLGEGARILRLEAERHEGGVLVRTVSARAGDDGLRVRRVLPDGRVLESSAPAATVPSALAPLLIAARRTDGERICVRALDESSGRVGEACGSARRGQVAGEILGESFIAQVREGRLERLELPGLRTTFTRTVDPPSALRPPDFFDQGLAVAGLAGREEDAALELVVKAPERLSLPSGAGQSARAGAEGVRVRWSRVEPPRDEPLGRPRKLGGPLDDAASGACEEASGRWAAAKALAALVEAHVEDDRPFVGERSAEKVWSERRGSCVGRVELFLALARRCGLPARKALGLVAADGQLWSHAWAQVEVHGAWWDVEPTEGEAPPRSARVLFAAGEAEAEAAAGRWLARLSAGAEISVPSELGAEGLVGCDARSSP